MRKLIEDNVEDVEVFLQGSYANSTNVRDNSDIDMVVIYNGSWDRPSWSLFENVRDKRDHLYNAINGKNNLQFTRKSKSVRYEGSADYIPADLVPCIRHKNTEGHDGVKIHDHRRYTSIISYPKQHKENGKIKSKDTDGNFKKAVRMFKNARNYAVDKRLLNEDACPSYCLECLLYNVKDDSFSGDESDIFYNTLKILYDSRHNLHNLKRQNEIQNLFGGGDSCWSTSNAAKSIEGIAQVWDKWGDIR